MDTFAIGLKNLEDFCCLTGVLPEQIQEAEEELCTHFSEEYRHYLMEYGLASAAGHEFTGITKSAAWNVVEVTLEARKRISAIPDEWYVVETLDIDGILIWQSPKGDIFQSDSNGEYEEIYGSLGEYLEAIASQC